MTHADEHIPAVYRIRPGDAFRPLTGGPIHLAKLNPYQRRAEAPMACRAMCGELVEGHLAKIPEDDEGRRCPECFPEGDSDPEVPA